MIELFRKINDNWFLTEPLLFSVLCTHKLVEKTKGLPIPMRSGKMRIEYNSEILKRYPPNLIEEFLKFEIIRIILKHPYQRKPFNAHYGLLSSSSNFTILENYDSTIYVNAESVDFPPNLCFEEYYKLGLELINNSEATNTEGTKFPKQGEDGKEWDDEDFENENSNDEQSENNSNDELSDTTSPKNENSNNDELDNTTSPKNNNNENGDNTENNSNDESGNTTSPKNDNNETCQEGNNTQPQNQPDDGGNKSNVNSEHETNNQSGDQESQNQPSNVEKIISPEMEELSALWEEDDLAESNINQLIHQAQESKSWGTISNNLIATIEASLIIKMDYRKILNSFRANIISSQRKLTRMYPSRRYGFQAMGSKSDFTTKLLMAIDVSGSVTDEDLQNFFSVVNRFFKYGIKEIDVIQFDTEIKGEVIPFKGAKKTIEIKGRGGTCFQSVFDYISDNPTYDGLLIFTDGYAPTPILKRKLRTKILWFLDNEESYTRHQHWIEEIPKSKAVWIP